MNFLVISKVTAIQTINTKIEKLLLKRTVYDELNDKKSMQRVRLAVTDTIL